MISNKVSRNSMSVMARHARVRETCYKELKQMLLVLNVFRSNARYIMLKSSMMIMVKL